MPRPRRTDLNEATTRSIKQTARQLMVEHGTAGLSLRAIARQLDMSAAALYHYFPSLHDLITALITDAFHSQAATIRQARDTAATQSASYRTQLFAAMLAYRDWALAYPIDFQLIYGNPIPGYAAPADITTPAARAVGAVFLDILIPALQQGMLIVPATYQNVPPSVVLHYRDFLENTHDNIQIQAMYLMSSVWGLLHGLVALEVYNHLAPVVGDTDAFYRAQVTSLLTMLEPHKRTLL